jgi:penicillin-insensitive murein endopeptidase
MVSRIAALFILALVVAGSLVVAEQMSVAQAPPASAADQATPAVPTPAPPAVPTQPAAPAPAAQPAAPPAQAPAVSAPSTPAPLVSAPPAQAPAPVVAAPLAPAPVVSAPPAQAPAPVVSAPPAEAPKPVMAAPPEAKPAPVVEAPMPPEKPAITLKEKEKGVPAKFLFASKKLPSLGRAMAIGYYPRGCLQGGVELPVTGPNWQVMRLERNRNWGHPELIHFLKRFAPLAAKATGWHGVLIGDMAQPRGGPLPFGHTSHQIGLDVDIWFMPMPGRVLTTDERNKISASYLVAPDGLHVNDNWSPSDAAFIRTAAEQPEVERVLVNAAIKKKLCEMEGAHHYAWMSKVRPWYGHADHIHVRLKCPADSPHCRHQDPVPSGDSCAKKDLAFWFADRILHPKPSKKPEKPRPGLSMADLPPACKEVLNAPAKKTDLAADGK